MSMAGGRHRSGEAILAAHPREHRNILDEVSMMRLD
jgi:hypothetical protein